MVLAGNHCFLSGTADSAARVNCVYSYKMETNEPLKTQLHSKLNDFSSLARFVSSQYLHSSVFVTRCMPLGVTIHPRIVLINIMIFIAQ